MLAAGLAALMSTMDSQLLTVSSIFSRDLYPLFSGRKPETARVGRLFVALMALAGLLLSLDPPGTILKIALWPFTGLAVLFPTVLFGLYMKNPRPAPAIASILAGEGLALAYIFKLPPSFGFLPAVPVIAVSIAVYMLVHAITAPITLPSFKPKDWVYAIGFILIFFLSIDVWNWNQTGSLWLAWPSWAWYFGLLSLAQTVLMVFWVRASEAS